MGIQPSELETAPLALMFEDLEYLELDAKYSKPKQNPERPTRQR